MPAAVDPFGDLTAAYAAQLRRTGQVVSHYRTTGQRELLRRAGRAAGRQLGRPVRTFDCPEMDGSGQVIVSLADWSHASPLESTLANTRVRNAIDRAFGSQPAP